MRPISCGRPIIDGCPNQFMIHYLCNEFLTNRWLFCDYTGCAIDYYLYQSCIVIDSDCTSYNDDNWRKHVNSEETCLAIRPFTLTVITIIIPFHVNPFVTATNNTAILNYVVINGQLQGRESSTIPQISKGNYSLHNVLQDLSWISCFMDNLNINCTGATAFEFQVRLIETEQVCNVLITAIHLSGVTLSCICTVFSSVMALKSLHVSICKLPSGNLGQSS